MRKRIKIRVIKNSKDFSKYTSAIHERKILLTLNKPIYLGFTVLKLSKWEVHDFHYNFMIRKFNTKLVFTDTDSLCYEIYGKKPHKKITTKN